MEESKLIELIQSVPYSGNGLNELYGLLNKLESEKHFLQIQLNKLIDWKYDTKVDLLIHLERLRGE